MAHFAPGYPNYLFQIDGASRKLCRAYCKPWLSRDLVDIN